MHVVTVIKDPRVPTYYTKIWANTCSTETERKEENTYLQPQNVIEKSAKVVHCIQSETVLPDSFFELSRFRSPKATTTLLIPWQVKPVAYRAVEDAQASSGRGLAKSCLLLFLHH